jgi:PST family polysaccharide transporter
MKYIAIANTISKVTFAIFIIYFIKIPSDYIYVNLLQGLGGIIASIICNIVALTILNVKLVPVSLNSIVLEIKDGWVLFLSALAVNIYTISNAFILGIFSSPVQLGYYSVAEKVYFALKTFGNVFSQVIFPKICVLANQSINELRKFQRKVFIPFVFALTICSGTIFFLANFISLYFLKEHNPYEVMLIRIFCIVPLIVAFDIPSFQALLAMNKKKQYGSALITGSVINIILNLLLVNYFDALGTTVSVLLTELFITISLIIGFNKVVTNSKAILPAV